MADYNPEKTCIVVGYPRSGNTWLVRMIAELLNSPVSRFGNALPIGTEGNHRKGDWLVTQLHLRPLFDLESKEAIRDSWAFNFNAWKGENIILISRDPRDVAISAMHYWELESIRKALNCMYEGSEIFHPMGNWSEFYRRWFSLWNDNFDSNKIYLPQFVTSYEFLHANTFEVMKAIHSVLTGFEAEDKKVLEVISNQEFKNKKEEISKEVFNNTSESRPYGKAIQLKAMRNGMPFQWRELISEEDNEFAWEKFGEMMKWMDYPKT